MKKNFKKLFIISFLFVTIAGFINIPFSNAQYTTNNTTSGQILGSPTTSSGLNIYGNTALPIGATGYTTSTLPSSSMGTSATTSPSTSDLQNQLNQLQNVYSQLLNRYNQQRSAGTSTMQTFSRDLTVGSSGIDVMALQQFLNSHDAIIASTGAGSPDNETNTFGTLTRSALARWQAANGVTPARGYFGAKTRVLINQIIVQESTAPTPSGTGTTTTTTLMANNVLISLVPTTQTATSGSFMSTRTPVIGFMVTAPSTDGSITLNSVTFQKFGTISDSGITNAYLLDNQGIVLASNSATSTQSMGNMLSFNNLGISIPAGQSRQFSLAVDLQPGVTSGNVNFSIQSASNISVTSANGNVNIQGNFPLIGNTFNASVTNPSQASITISASSTGTTVGSQTNNGYWTFTVANNPVYLKAINFTINGLTNPTDIIGLRLYVNGSQYGNISSTSVLSNGTAYFNLSSNPVLLQVGANSIQLMADVTTTSRSFTFSILHNYDVYATDTVYNANVPIYLQY